LVPCGSNTASLLFVAQQVFGVCADQGAVAGVPAGSGAAVGGAAGGLDQTASQQAITAVGGAQQNPCGSNTASLLFVTQQDFGECADQGAVAGVPAGSVAAGHGAAGGLGQTGAQERKSAVGGARQEPCWSSLS